MRLNPFLAVACGLLFFEPAFCQTGKGDWSLVDQPDFAISYPADWTLDQSGQAGTKFILYTGKTSLGFRDNVNLITQDLKGSGYDLDRYVALSESQVKTMITNSQLIASKRIKSPGGEFQELVFTGDQGVYKLKWSQRYWVIGEKAFVLTFTASQETFDLYGQDGQKLFDSFKPKGE